MQRSLVAFVLVAIMLVVFAPIVLGGQTWDDVRYHTEIAPPRIAAADAVLHGELPTWWEGTALGVPLLGEPSHGAAYPVGWIAATPRAIDLLAIVHVLWCGIGVALWTRQLRKRRVIDLGEPERAPEVGAVVAGVLVMTSGVIASAAIRGALPALAQVPWLAVTAMSLSSARSRSRRIRLAVALAILLGLVGLSGQLAVLALGIALVLLCSWSLFAAIGIVGGLGIASVQWLPAIYAIHDSAGATTHGLPLSRLIELIVPLRNSDAWFPTVFVGVAVFALAAISQPRKRFAILVAVLAVLAFVVGRGGWPAWLGAPELYLATLGLVAAAHAGIGFDALLAGERRAFVALAGAAVALVLALGGLVALRARVDADAADAIDRALMSGGLGVLCCAGALVIVWRTRARTPSRALDLRALLLAVLVVAPSVGSVPTTSPTIERAIVSEPPAWVTAAITPTELTLLDGQAKDAGPLRVFRPIMTFAGPKGSTPEPTLADAIATLAGTSASIWGVGSARSDDAARPNVHDRVWRAAAAAGGQLLDRYGITLAILPSSMTGGSSGLKAIATRGNWALVRYPASPTAALVNEWIFVADVDTALTRMFPPGTKRGLGSGLVVLAGHGVENQDEPGPAQPCAIDRWSGSAIDVTCVADNAAYAVITSTPARGWSATVDGREAQWLVADVMRRAIAVPPGTHHVAWRYTAPGLSLALVLAALGIVALVALWLVYGRADARDRTPDPARSDPN